MPSSINSYIFAIFAAVVDSREALSTDESRSAGLLPKAESMRSRRDSPPSPLILYRLFASDIIDGECDEIMNCAFVKMRGRRSAIAVCQSGCRCRSSSSTRMIAEVSSGFFFCGFATAMRMAMSAISAITVFSPSERLAAGTFFEPKNNAPSFTEKSQ